MGGSSLDLALEVDLKQLTRHQCNPAKVSTETASDTDSPLTVCKLDNSSDITGHRFGLAKPNDPEQELRISR
jgi:hypothetical protein